MIWSVSHPRFPRRFREPSSSHHPQGPNSSAQPTRFQSARREERLRIARELHDTLLQGLLSASMQLCLANDALSSDSPAKPLLERALDLMRKGLDDGRAALFGLRSRIPPDGSLEMALSQIPQEFASSRPAQLRIVIIVRTKSLDPALFEQVFLIAREALLNAFRHSQATQIEAEIEYLRRQLRVVVRDNGIGFDAQTLRSRQNSHWGFHGMRERAISIGAKLQLRSRSAAGTELALSVPLRRPHIHPAAM